MLRYAILAVVLASAAVADPVLHWGASSASLVPCHEADACVIVINRLSASPALVYGTLSDEAVVIGIEGVMGRGAEPDFIKIEPCLGCRVEPPQADIPEDGAQVFRIYFPLLG